MRSRDRGRLQMKARHLAMLRTLLAQQGFRNLPEEWWHYTLANEPYADSYFDFPVR